MSFVIANDDGKVVGRRASLSAAEKLARSIVAEYGGTLEIQDALARRTIAFVRKDAFDRVWTDVSSPHLL